MSLLALIAVLLFVFSGCGDDSSKQHSMVVTENDLFSNSLRVATHQHTIVIHLEHPDGEGHDKDLGENGVDEIPVHYSEDVNHTFCWEDDTSDAWHSMELIDSNGNTVLTEHINGECANATITAGHYTMRFTHGGQSEGTQAIFIRLDEDNVKSSGIVNMASVEDNIKTLITTNECSYCDLSYANLTGANLSHAWLRYANLREASLYGADLSWADCYYANLSGADLSHANLAWALLSNSDLREAYISNADLHSVAMIEANLRGAKLNKSDLYGADLSGANLSYVDLSEANLSYADLPGVDLSYADLSAANLSYADLSGVDLTDADLSAANLSYADLSGVDLTDADLSLAIWVDGTRCEEESIGTCRPPYPWAPLTPAPGEDDKERII
jgi:uncharacterized protein YjbI with pentapeptide repeats